MKLLLILFVLITLTESSIWLPWTWRYHRQIAVSLIVASPLFYLALIFARPSLWAVTLSAAGVYRLVNLARLYKDRIQPENLYYSSRKTAFWLVVTQLVIVIIAVSLERLALTSVAAYYGLALLQLAFAITAFSALRRQLKKSKPSPIETTTPDRDLPSLTVAIPARNETADLQECLRSLLASNYPKLEIIVLDDCSQNRHTPEIIRSFAHDGVRFIGGEAPSPKWLAKNYAYQQLSEEANGDLILFCGVDIRFTPNSLRVLVETLVKRRKNMISVLPRNFLPKDHNHMQNLAQSNRYAWELILPRRFFERPPVLSSCWLISKEILKRAGGFNAVTHQAVPESYFAYYTAAHDDAYSFIISDNQINISSQKDADEQRATAIRTRYPQLHKRIELTLLLTLFEASLMLWPIVVLVSAIIGSQWMLATIAALGFIIQSLVYAKVINVTYRRPILAAPLLLVPAVFYDLWVLNHSMWKYEFDDVIWKGRNVCIPVMRVYPNLPRA